MSNTNLLPDLNQAQTMLKALAPSNGAFTFQTFADGSDKNKALIKQFNGSFEQHASQLTQLNQQGAGVFVTINQTDLQGRKAENITAVRAVFVDFDNSRADRLNDLLSLDRLYDGALKPSFIVETSTGKHHAYWLADGIPLDEFKLYQETLIYFFSGLFDGDNVDKAIHDLPRIMRLAGFYHNKGEPILTKIVYPNGGQDIQRYSYEQIKAMIDSLPAPLAQASLLQTNSNTHTSKVILPQSPANSQTLPQLTAEKVRTLSRGRWDIILNRLGYAVSTNPKEPTQCPVCGGKDRFRFDNQQGTGSYICSQGTGENSAGDGLSLLIDHAGMTPQQAIASVTGVLNEMGLLSPYDGLDSPQAIEWGEPSPIVATLPPVKTITPDMLPKPIYDYVANHSERLAVPLEFIAIPVTVALGAVIGTKVRIYPKIYDNWSITPNLWGGVIGNPSTKKTPSIDTGLKGIKQLATHASKQYETAKKEHKANSIINGKKKTLENKTLEKLIEKQASQKDKPPKDESDRVTDEQIKEQAKLIAELESQAMPTLKRYVVDDSTYEKLGDLESENPHGLLVNRDELTGLFAFLDKPENEQARNFYLEGYNGTGNKSFDRVTRGTIFLEKHCLSVIGGIQPDKIEYYLSKSIKGLSNDGLMQRFSLLVYPDPIANIKEPDKPVNTEIRDIVYRIFTTLDNLSPYDLVRYGANAPDEYNSDPYFKLTGEAHELFMNWYDELKAKANRAEHSIIAEHLMKYPKTLASLALIFHLVDCVEYGRIGNISLHALQAAAKFLDMLESHMIRIYSTVTDNAQIKASLLSIKLLDMLKRPTTGKPNDWIARGFTARQVMQKNWKGLTDKDDIQTAIDVLIEHDWLAWEAIQTTGQGGRPTERYTINPKVTKFL